MDVDTLDRYGSAPARFILTPAVFCFSSSVLSNAASLRYEVPVFGHIASRILDDE